MAGLVRERLEPGVEVLRLDRPSVRNALDTQTTSALADALEELAADETAAAVVLSTTSGSFCAGADVQEALSAEAGVARMEQFARLYAAVEAVPQPLLCVCVGDVVGAGTELAMGSDLRVADPTLRLRWVGGVLGVPVGVARLVPLVGVARAKELILTGRRLGLPEAVELGLVDREAPAGAAEQTAVEIARELAGRPREGLRLIKRLFRELERGADRVAHENGVLVDWQRHGAGLPRRAAD